MVPKFCVNCGSGNLDDGSKVPAMREGEPTPTKVFDVMCNDCGEIYEVLVAEDK